jgi:hypothetical protein
MAVAVAAVAVALLLIGTGREAFGEDGAACCATETGFTIPFSGPLKFEYLAPTQATNRRQINRPIGQERANEIAGQMRLKEQHTLNDRQFREFISGRGCGGDPEMAALADRSVQIFTNTKGRPLYSLVDGVRTPTVLASYGLFVNKRGELMSLANQAAPTRIANVLLEPGGYINTWFLHNHAKRSLFQLYTSAYTKEAFYGFIAQSISPPSQLVTNTKLGVRRQVGMSMAPALWLTNFALLYTLKPEIAAKMPAYWTPIPEPVAEALRNSRTGRVRYSDYASYFDQNL